MTLEVKHIYPRLLTGIFFALLFLPSCGDQVNFFTDPVGDSQSLGENDSFQLTEIKGEAQGTYYSIKYHSSDEEVSKEEIDYLFDQFDSSLSTYKDYSLISRFNRNEEVFLDDWFIEMIVQSRLVYTATNGAFDPTVLPLVRAWGFGPEGRTYESEEGLEELLKKVGLEHLFIAEDIDTGGMVLQREIEGIQLDFNAIAQGYISDIIAEYLEERGIDNYLIDSGGELKAKGVNAKGDVWSIGIDRPQDGERSLQAVLSLDNKAVATSGNYRKYYMKDGVKYSHTISPFTGQPVQHSLLSATVITDSCSIADAYATAMMVLGLEKAKTIIDQKENLEAYLIYSDKDGNTQTFSSEGLKAFIKERD